MSALLIDFDPRGVATITLNRPARHNAFDAALISELRAALRDLGARPALRAVVLTGAGASFCAGADLDWMRATAELPEADNLCDARALVELMTVLDTLPCPTVALIQGAAFGGGVGLAACCDIVIASDRARFALSEVRLGLIPAAIGPFVIAAIGAREARRLFQTGEVIDAAEARQIGLVHRVVPAAGLPAAYAEVLDHLLAGAPGAQREAKALVARCGRAAPDLAEHTARCIATRRASPEGREGVAAFLERRTPVWQAL